ncbi:6-hydroxymethylpterin diphosphokinase MptE-like protein [Succinivibrio sp.]|uniref:motility associated factor glycosyltransferase family protein n=1 Tax=Succinivibrio sp. TaxID=2053619 RepID=UPI0025FCF6AD|nr:6-hydroxymethylpterin diphosphokinase MptE-like protein [Succinivibrio sp.]MBQ9220156.1 motility associated factor glycosyltransferase family protein [Succinivibrio sp.]
MTENRINPFVHKDTELEQLEKEYADIFVESLKDLHEITELQGVMKQDLVYRFKRNIEAFRKYIPEVAKKFENYKVKTGMDFFCLKNEIPNLIFTESNDILYKTDNPFELSKNQIDQIINNTIISQLRYQMEYDPYGQLHFKYNNRLIEIEQSKIRDQSVTPKQIESLPNCVMLGIGLGYPLADLYNQVEIANLIIVEPNPDIFYASLQAFEWAPFLDYIFENKLGIHLMIGQNADQFFLDLERFYDHHGRFLSGTWLGFTHYSNKKVKEFVALFDKHYRSLNAAMGFTDDHLFGASHGCYAILNHKNFVLNTPLKEDYKNNPVFIIGSGPSLDHDIPFIRKYQDKAIIIACGTAIDALYHAGIKPDFYANTERTPQIKQALSTIPDRQFFDDIVLLTGDVCHPYTLNEFKHTAIFGKPDEPLYPYLAMNFPEYRQVQYLQLMNPLVGNMGLSGAIFLGFENLYLFGLDNGKKLGSNTMHSEYTTLYKERGVGDTGGNYTITKTVPANFGGKCETGYLFDLSRRNMDFLLQMEKLNRKNLVCHNCSDGALLEQAAPVHSDELCVTFEKLPDIDKKAFFSYIKDEKTAKINLSEEQLTKAFDKEIFTQTCNKLKEIIQNKPDNRVEYIKNMETVSEVLYYLKTAPSTYFYGAALEGSIQTFFMQIARMLYHSKDEKACIELANQGMDVICDFLDEIPDLFSHMPFIYLGEHQQIYKEGKVGKDMPHCKAPNLPKMHILVKDDDYKDPLAKFVKRYE